MGDSDVKFLQQDNLDRWKDTLGEDAESLWEALDEESPPPYFSQVEGKHGTLMLWRMATVVAVLLGILLLGINLHQRSQLRALAIDNAIQKLNSSEIRTRFAGVEQLQEMHSGLSDAAVRELFTLLASSEDPNLQLSILEILVAQKCVDGVEDIPTGYGAAKSQFLRTVYEKLYRKEGGKHDPL